jgi:hypothetical protein
MGLNVMGFTISIKTHSMRGKIMVGFDLEKTYDVRERHFTVPWNDGKVHKLEFKCWVAFTTKAEVDAYAKDCRDGDLRVRVVKGVHNGIKVYLPYIQGEY